MVTDIAEALESNALAIARNISALAMPNKPRKIIRNGRVLFYIYSCMSYKTFMKKFAAIPNEDE